MEYSGRMGESNSEKKLLEERARDKNGPDHDKECIFIKHTKRAKGRIWEQAKQESNRFRFAS